MAKTDLAMVAMVALGLLGVAIVVAGGLFALALAQNASPSMSPIPAAPTFTFQPTNGGPSVPVSPMGYMDVWMPVDDGTANRQKTGVSP